MAKTSIQSIRGVRDLLADETPYWLYLEKILQNVCFSYGYENIRIPVIEKTELFQKSIGVATDIVEKEMYTFDDRNGDSLTLRPEGTAGTVRMMIQHNLLRSGAKKYWYLGPMFRHERPQKERFRQFDQFGLEVYGISSADIDVEVLLICKRIWSLIGIDKNVSLQINSLGVIDSRKKYREELVKYFTKHEKLLDDDSKRRLHSNPLRILDSKNEAMQEVIEKAPSILAFLDVKSKEHFDKVCSLLDKSGIEFTINSKLVRGLDYYNDTVFEWVTDELGSQGTICAGGRYDSLVSQLGGPSCPAIGFALGLDRVIHLLQQNVDKSKVVKKTDIFIISQGEQARGEALVIAENLRTKYKKFNIITYCGDGNFKKQFKEADKANASLALILGDDEVKKNTIAVKYLNEKIEQKEYTINQFEQFIEQYYLQKGNKNDL